MDPHEVEQHGSGKWGPHSGTNNAAQDVGQVPSHEARSSRNIGALPRHGGAFRGFRTDPADRRRRHRPKPELRKVEVGQILTSHARAPSRTRRRQGLEVRTWGEGGNTSAQDVWQLKVGGPKQGSRPKNPTKRSTPFGRLAEACSHLEDKGPRKIETCRMQGASFAQTAESQVPHGYLPKEASESATTCA